MMTYPKFFTFWFCVSTTHFIPGELDNRSRQGLLGSTIEENITQTWKNHFVPKEDKTHMLESENFNKSVEWITSSSKSNGKPLQSSPTPMEEDANEIFQGGIEGLKTSTQTFSTSFLSNNDTDMSNTHETVTTKNVRNNCTVIRTKLRRKQFPTTHTKTTGIRVKGTTRKRACGNSEKNLFSPKMNSTEYKRTNDIDETAKTKAIISDIVSDSELLAYMTCESVLGLTTKFQVISKSDKVTAVHQSYKKCNSVSSLDVDNVLPVVHKSLGVVFRNLYCVIGSRLPRRLVRSDQSEYWKISIAKQCYDFHIINTKSKYYLHFLNGILRNSSCKARILPPLDYVNQINIQGSDKECALPLTKACSENNTLKRRFCLLCSWTNDQKICNNSFQGNAEKELQTYYLLQSPSDGLEENKCRRLIHPKMCYNEICKTGQLGQKNRCFTPIERVAGLVTHVWMRLRYNGTSFRNDIDELIRNLSESLQNESVNVSALEKIKMLTSETSVKDANGWNCMVKHVMYYSMKYIEYEQIQIFNIRLNESLKHVQELRTNKVIISGHMLTCIDGKHMLRPDVHTESEEEIKSLFIYIFVAVCFVIVLIAPVISAIKKHFLNRSND